MFGLSLAEEIKEHNVGLAVCELGPIDTEFTIAAGASDDLANEMASMSISSASTAAACLEDLRVGNIVSYGTLPKSIINNLTPLMTRERWAALFGKQTKSVVERLK